MYGNPYQLLTFKVPRLYLLNEVQCRVCMEEKIAIRKGWWDCLVMPIVMESNMFCYSIGRPISSYTSMGVAL